MNCFGIPTKQQRTEKMYLPETQSKKKKMNVARHITRCLPVERNFTLLPEVSLTQQNKRFTALDTKIIVSACFMSF